MAKKFFNLHIYIREIEKLYLTTYEWKYINIVNSCNSLHVGIWTDGMLHISCRKPQTLGWDCSGSGIWCSYCCLKKLYFFTTQESLQKTTFDDESLQPLSNAHPAFCWVVYLQWQKYHCQELERTQRKKSHGTINWVVGITVDDPLERKIISTRKSLQQHKTYQLQPQTFVLPNTMSSVTWSRGKVKFSSSTSGSPISAG